MSMSDPIANMLTIIRNGLKAKKDNVNIPSSKINLCIAEIFKKEGYIENFKLVEDKKQGILRVYLKYISGKPAIIGVKRISKPGLRVYRKQDKMYRVLRGLGVAVVSTSRGLMTDNQAREAKIGGEILCHIW